MLASICLRVCIALAACVLPTLAAASQPVVEQPPQDVFAIRWDPAIRHGVLANGLRYAVMSNPTPASGVSIRMGVVVGSLDDEKDALGEAHFLEHMAFGGSHAQLQPDVEKAFAALGVAFGRDRNAHTDTLSTTYEIDLPHGDANALGLSFHWLRAVADGAQLTADAVERERGVIQAEREARLSDITNVSEQALAFQAPGSLAARGPSVGTTDSIANISAARLQAFYDRWYRPDNAVVVVVGDASLDQLEALVRRNFDDWRARAPAPVRSPAPPVDETRSLDALSLQQSHFPDAIGVCRIQTPHADMPYDAKVVRRQVLTQTWVEIANTRLGQARQAPGSGLVEVKAYVVNARRQMESACIAGVVTHDAWPAALAGIEREVVRLNDTTPDDRELEAAIKVLRGRVRSMLYGKDTRVSSDLAKTMLVAMLEDRPYVSPAEAMRVFDVAVEGLTPEDLHKAFAADWSGAGPLVQVLGDQPPPTDTIRKTWTDGASPAGGPTSTSTTAATKAATWAYSGFGLPGRVVKREVIPGADAVRITYANGVRLNFKHTAFESDSVEVRLTFGLGRRELAGSDYLPAVIGGALLERGGLGKNTYQDVTTLFSENGLHVTMGVHDQAFALASQTAKNGLSNDLQLMAAYATDPGFRDLDGLLGVVWRAGLRHARTYPSIMVEESLINAIAPGAPTSLTAALAHTPLTGDDLARSLKPALTQDPLEVTIVGAVDEATAISATAATFGALPARKTAAHARPDTWFLRFPDHPPAVVQGYHDGPAEKVAAALVWPLYVAEPARRREEYAIHIAALVLQEALLRRIRGDLGETYAPTVEILTPDFGDQGTVIATIEASVANLTQVRAEMRAVASKIAQGDFTDDDIDTVRKPLLQQLTKRTQTDEAWANALQDSSVDATGLNDFEQAPDLIASITPAEVRKAAATWLMPTPIAVIVTKTPAAGDAKPSVAKP